jgi:RNA polymerase primary sigma factor
MCPGFAFRYLVGGGRPSIRRLARGDCAALAAGDMVTVRASRLAPATSADSALVGNVLRCGGSAVEIVTDAEAVYGVTDPHRRAAGTALDLAGASGCQRVAEGPNRAFQVVVDCSAAEETLLRIAPGRQRDLPVALLGDSHATGMSPVDERRLVADAAAGDPEARRALVEAHLPAIGGVARLYRSTAGVGREELLQEGVLGLLRALARFDPELGAPFWAYASWWVRQAMQQLVSDLAHAAVLSDRAQRGLARIRDTREDHLQAHGQEPSTDDLAAATELPREQVQRLLAVDRTPRGLEEPIARDDGPAATLEDTIADPLAQAESEAVIDRLEIEEVRHLTAGLDDRERMIINDHYGIGRPPRTLAQIATDLGVSAERVRQIEEQSLCRIRAGLGQRQ